MIGQPPRANLAIVESTRLQNKHAGWFIVTQVKANRVIYFTDDPSYEPPMEGNWYFVTHHVGELPPEMTLRNCWGWRFNGGVFSDVRERPTKASLDSLLESNRKALLTLLRDKVNRARQALASTCLLGDEVRRLKLDEAERYQSLGTEGVRQDENEFAYLEAVASARAMPMTAAAELVLQRESTLKHELVKSERQREHLTQEILVADTQERLIELRRVVLEELAPELSQRFAYPANPMTPEEWLQPLTPVHRAHECARLRVRLRELVNARRMRIHDGYLEGETLFRQKAKLAQTLLNNEGQPPASVDFSLLQSMADAHGMSLVDAARLALGAANDAEAILRSTEALKDRMLAAIHRVQSIRDIQRVDKELQDAAHVGKA